MPASAVTAAFLAALFVSTALHAWLTLRQMRHVAAHRDAVPPAFADSITPAQHRKAADYTAAKMRLALVMQAVDVPLLLVLTLGGLLQWFDQSLAAAIGSRGHLHGLALFACVGLVSFAVGLPFAVYRSFVLEARFGFNKMTPALFVSDLVKQLLLAVVIGAPVALTVLWLMDAMGGNWWLYVWLFWLGFNLLVLLLYPTLIAPLFNKFSPLADPELKARIEDLLARCGFKAAGLFVMDGSRRSSHGNAYFTGFGRSRRIVFFDTLIEKLTPAEVEAVLAHELGHYKLHHVWKRIALLAAVSLGLLWLLGRLMSDPAFFHGLGVETPGTATALILFAFVLPLFSFPFAPIASHLSRRHEFEADAYAAGQSSSNELASALVTLYRDNAATLTPDPLYSLFHDSHPPASQRIARLKAT